MGSKVGKTRLSQSGQDVSLGSRDIQARAGRMARSYLPGRASRARSKFRATPPQDFMNVPTNHPIFFIA